MKRVYKYEVFGATYYEGIAEGISDTFDSLKDAKYFVEKAHNGRFHKIHKTIFKYEERSGEAYRYVKRLWFFKEGRWYSTRKIHKQLLFMEI